MGVGKVSYGKAYAIGVNRYQSHDFILDAPDKPAIILYLYICLPWLDDVCKDLGNPVSLESPQILLTPEIRLATWQLMQKVISLKDASIQKIELEVISLLRLTITQAAIQMLPKVWPQRRKLLDYRLRLILSFMKDNSASSAAIGDVAKRVGISRSRLYELFQTELDSTPQIVWNSMLTKRAVQSVRGSQDDLSVVASTLGFSTAGNFSRYFRSVMGISPRVFRKMNLSFQARAKELFSISYTSYAAHTLTEQDLTQILQGARMRNARLKLTGALLYVRGAFMQYLEGSKHELLEALEFITTSTHHHQIKMGEFHAIQQRAYPSQPLAFMSEQLAEPSFELRQPEMRRFLAVGNLTR